MLAKCTYHFIAAISGNRSSHPNPNEIHALSLVNLYPQKGFSPMRCPIFHLHSLHFSHHALIIKGSNRIPLIKLQSTSHYSTTMNLIAIGITLSSITFFLFSSSSLYCYFSPLSGGSGVFKGCEEDKYWRRIRILQNLFFVHPPIHITEIQRARSNEAGYLSSLE